MNNYQSTDQRSYFPKISFFFLPLFRNQADHFQGGGDDQSQRWAAHHKGKQNSWDMLGDTGIKAVDHGMSPGNLGKSDMQETCVQESGEPIGALFE